LGAVFAYPVFTALVFTQTVEAGEASTSTRDRAAQPGASRTIDLWPIAEACRAVAEANDLPLALQQATSVVAKTLKADLAAVGVPGGSPDTVEFVAIHHPVARPELGAMFSLDSQPSVKRAISHKRPVLLGSERGDEAKTLSLLMGSETVRPMIILPLIHNHETLACSFLAGD